MTKQCKHCKETIDKTAKKCKFCGSDVRNWFIRHKIITAIILIPFVAGIISAATSNSNGNNKYQSPVQLEKLSPFEIVNDGATNDKKSIDIYTTEKQPSELIKINDKLIDDNKQYLYLFIRYFDDKVIAKDYFIKQGDESISEKEKDQLFAHYTADYKSTVNKLNINKDGNWVEIKSY